MKNIEDIHTVIDWILTERCNLNCYYCLQNADTRNAVCAPINHTFIQRMEAPFLFHLTGGEPFMVPNLIELCNNLHSNGHYISINTNLTISPKDFIQEVNCERILFINTSVHYPYRKLHMKPFLQKYRLFKEAGYFIYATVVMIPELFDEIIEFIRKYQDEGIIILPKLMRGINSGSVYPKSYNNIQWLKMKEVIENTKGSMTSEEHESFKTVCQYNVSIDNWWDYNIGFTGTRCFDGNRYIRVTEDGDIVFCDSCFVGNVYREGFNMPEIDKKCDYSVENLCLKHI